MPNTWTLESKVTLEERQASDIRVLIVEDSEDDAVLLIRHLRRAGFHLTYECVDTLSALEQSLNRRWDLVLADWHLPAFDAQTALSMVQARGDDVPFIIISGVVSEEDAIAAMQAGAHDYIRKENPARLIPAIERELREAAGRGARRKADADCEAASKRLVALEDTVANMDLMLAMVVHEIRTPLNSITGFADLLFEGLAGALSPRQRSYVERILAAASTVAFYSSDLLDMSRMKAGHFSLKLEEIRLVEVIQRVASSIRPMMNVKQLSLEVQAPERLPMVSADAARIAQVIFNLVTNAIKFSPPGGAIRIELSMAAGLVRCEVRDQGPGISMHDIPELFRPFRQLKHGQAAGGTGLGLSICKRLVEAHGGAIAIDSAPGQGTCIWFTIPGCERASREAEALKA